MKQGMARDLGYLRTLTENLRDDVNIGSVVVLSLGVVKALETITRMLEDLARDVEQAEYTANSTQGALRRYGMR
jgi:hypothetical protein